MVNNLQYILYICIQVDQKAQELQIDKAEAIFEVYTDRVLKIKGDSSEALLWIVTISTDLISEICVCAIE